ncbi:MAG: hypothetical protein KDD22_02930, partial [Bdellovibrionales bacterium]|nr:hypothetical protein [Bdellovibrionales bacterium]
MTLAGYRNLSKTSSLQKLVHVMLIIQLLMSPLAYGEAFSYSGSCMSEGVWTTAALDSSREIKRVLEELRKDKDCESISNLFSQIETPESPKADSEESQKVQTVMSNIAALRSTLVTGGANLSGLKILLGNLLEGAAWMAPTSTPSDGKQRLIGMGLTSIDALLDGVSKSNNCLIANPGMGATLIGHTIRMLSAFSSSGETNLSKLGSTIQKLTSFLRDNKFRTVIAQMDEVQIANSISCLLESTTENYCSALDAIEMLRFGNKNRDLIDFGSSTAGAEQVKGVEDPEYNPLEGYFILTRETPIISEWVQKVMFGVVPRTESDAVYKNTVLANINNFLQDENSLYGLYNQKALEYAALEPDARKNFLFELMQKIFSSMVDGGGGMGGVRADINFFTRAMQRQKIIYYLLGIDEVPAEVRPNDDGKFVMNDFDYISNGGAYRAPFENPDDLLKTMQVRMENIINMAKTNASNYFQQRLIVDTQNLVDQTLVSQTISVKEAIIHTKDYLSKLAKRARRSNKDSDKPILASILRTLGSLDKILDQYKSMDQWASAFIANANDDNLTLTQDQKKDISKIISNMISTVYMEFNMILQRDTFLLTRISTYVRYDYMYYLHEDQKLSDYQKQLLLTSGKNLLDLLRNSYNDSPTSSGLDLANAQTINMSNMRALEQIFRDKWLSIVANHKLVVDGKGNEYLTRWNSSLERILEDSRPNGKREHESTNTQTAHDLATDLFFKVFGNNLGLSMPNPLKTAKLVWNNWDRYMVSGRLLDQAPIQHDDTFNSFQKTWSKFCTQSLPFTNYYEYHK